jgi:hypothetical protein
MAFSLAVEVINTRARRSSGGGARHGDS